MSRCRALSVLVAWLALAPPPAAWGAPPPAPRGEGRTDRYGDPLPPGAVARLGAARFRLDRRPDDVAFAPDGGTLAVLTSTLETATLWLWDVQTGKNLRRLPLALLPHGGMAWLPDGRSLVVPGRQGVVRLDATTGTVLRRFEAAGEDLACVALSPDGTTLAAGCRARRLRQVSPILLWDVATGRQTGRLRGHTTPVRALAFAAGGRRLLSASEDDPGTAGTRF